MNGVWGVVCPTGRNGWSQKNTDVTCRQIGKKLGVTIISELNLR